MRYPLIAAFALWLALGLAFTPPGRGQTIPVAPVYLVGDSHAYRLGSIGPYSRNYGVPGRTTTELLSVVRGMYVRDGVTVLSIGANDVKQGQSAGLEGRLAQVSARIPGPVYWLQIPPMVRWDVREANAMIERVCRARPDCTLVPAPFGLADLGPDGVHLTEAKSRQWADAIGAAISQGM